MARFIGPMFKGKLAKAFSLTSSASSPFDQCRESLFHRRHLSMKSSVGNKFKEIEIPILNGKVAAKAWGTESAFPVLALHGWQNNCGTFDRLLPLLPDEFYWVAVDLPGHGRSSHKPMGSVYSDFSMMLDLKRVVDHLGWTQFHILGHSFGGRLSLQFACCFPDMVQKLMLLDATKLGSWADDQIPAHFRSIVNRYLQLEDRATREPRVRSPQEAEEVLKKETLGPDGVLREIEDEGVRVLLKRGVRECGTAGVVFSRDPRIDTVEHVSMRSHATVEKLVSTFQGELLVVLAKNIVQPAFQAATPEATARYVDLYRRNLKDKFVVERVDGTHFAHLNNPELVAPIIRRFLRVEGD